jgi:tRNA-specific 2-thiouridylase
VKVLCAMSGGVDSSVAAAVLLDQGHEVVGVTMRLWGGASDTGCCSIADVDDARRVAQQLGIDHLVFNFTEDFEAHVVAPYVAAHATGSTPNPCIECNRHLKFSRLHARADLLGFDAVATGHHARIVRAPVVGVRATPTASVELRVARGVDAAKDQSYVVHMLTQAELARTAFPIGSMTKDEVRARASALGLRTAGKPDSQDVCFITHSGGRAEFLGARIPLSPAVVRDRAGATVGSVPAVELVTIGQRRGIGLPGGGPKRYVLDVDVEAGVVVVGDDGDLLDDELDVVQLTWAGTEPAGRRRVRVQASAHGRAVPAEWLPTDGAGHRGRIRWDAPQRRVAPGQSVVLYDETDGWVWGGGLAARREAVQPTGS